MYVFIYDIIIIDLFEIVLYGNKLFHLIDTYKPTIKNMVNIMFNPDDISSNIMSVVQYVIVCFCIFSR